MSSSHEACAPSYHRCETWHTPARDRFEPARHDRVASPCTCPPDGGGAVLVMTLQGLIVVPSVEHVSLVTLMLESMVYKRWWQRLALLSVLFEAAKCIPLKGCCADGLQSV